MASPCSRFVSASQATHLRQIGAGTPVYFGWRLDVGHVVRSVKMRWHVHTGTTVSAAIAVRMALGCYEPDTLSAFDALRHQLVGGSIDTAVANEIETYGAISDWEFPVNRVIRDNDNILSVFVNTAAFSSVVAGLVLDPW